MSRADLRGFTLMEVVLSAAIAAILFVAVAVAVGGGLSAWRKAEELSSLTREGTKTLEMMEQGLLRSIASQDFLFEGSGSSIRFVTGGNAGPIQIRWGQETPVLGGRPVWVVASKPLSKPDPNVVETPEAKRLFEAVESVEFQFPYVEENDDGYGWLSDWRDENQRQVPQAVLVKMNLSIQGRTRLSMERLVVLPHGRLGTVESAP